MPTIYVNVPETGSGTSDDPYRADIDGTAVDRVMGNRIASSGQFVVRVDGPQAALDAIVARPDVDELPDVEAVITALNATGRTTLTTDSRLFD